MMYSNKLVCSVKVGRKILREKVENNESTVYIPFGSEYSLLLKNLGGRNAVVNIEIDGRKVSQNGFYIRSGQTSEIERFVENLVEGRRFKFIEKTEEISDFRGDRVDDGIVRVTWQFEKPLPEIKEIRYNYKHEHWHGYHHFGCTCPWCGPHPIWLGSNSYSNSYPDTITYTSNIGSAVGSGGTQSSCLTSRSLEGNIQSNACDKSVGNINFYKNSDSSAPGITVEGSKSNQKFGTAYASELEANVHSMVILLKGTTKENAYVNKPVTVHNKKQCPSCGRKWKNMEYCPNCGTSLK